jgi:hypothetical protein
MVTSTDELTIVEPAFVGDASQGHRVGAPYEFASGAAQGPSMAGKAILDSNAGDVFASIRSAAWGSMRASGGGPSAGERSKGQAAISTISHKERRWVGEDIQ